MSIAQPLNQNNPTSPINANYENALTLINQRLDNIQNGSMLRYEFTLKIQVRDLNCTVRKSMLSPLLPMTCNNITMDTGYYSIAHTTLDMDEKTINVWLAPLVVNPPAKINTADAFDQILKEHRRGGWHD